MCDTHLRPFEVSNTTVKKTFGGRDRGLHKANQHLNLSLPLHEGFNFFTERYNINYFGLTIKPVWDGWVLSFMRIVGYRTAAA